MKITPRLGCLLLACACLVSTASTIGHAQQAAPPAPKPEVLLKVDVVLSRWLADKKTGSLPFTLLVNTPGSGSGYASIRVGVDVPTGTLTSLTTVPNSSTAQNPVTTATTRNNTDYRSVGTSIDCRSTQLADGRFQVNVNVQDSSIFNETPAGRGSVRSAAPAAFQTFQMGNTLPMRDGQTLPFATATDKVSGEQLRVDVTLNVVK